jgi:probable addiction module antidote protein
MPSAYKPRILAGEHRLKSTVAIRAALLTVVTTPKGGGCDAIGTGNAAYIANAVGAVARARTGMSKLARDTGIKRQTLTKSLGKKGNPTLATIVPVLDKLGLRMQIVPATPAN